MTRAIVIIAALISVFILPLPVTAVLAAFGSLMFPPTALAVGILIDVLYLPSGTPPYATIMGVAGFVAAVFVRRFMKTRIIGG